MNLIGYSCYFHELFFCLRFEFLFWAKVLLSVFATLRFHFFILQCGLFPITSFMPN